MAIKELDQIFPENKLIPDNSSLELGVSIDSVLNRFQELSPETFEHCQRVRGYSLAFGKTLGLPAIEMLTLGMGAELHDIGKIADVLLVNNPDSLPSEEIEYYTKNAHQDVGFKLLNDMNFPKEVLKIVKEHHVDKYDKTNDLTNIVRIWDRYDAIVAGRFGQPPTYQVIAKERIRGLFGTRLDPQYEDRFLAFFHVE